MKVGYVRISTEDQTLNLQLDALKSAGCERTFTDTVGGAKVDRPGLTEALDFGRAGDTFVVWKLDRLGRSLMSLPPLVEVSICSALRANLRTYLMRLLKLAAQRDRL